jgi:group I intron endonuclease
MGYFIYEIRNIINGKRYIGCSKHIKVRFIKHKSRLKNNKHKNSYLQNAYNKYGKDNFEYNILLKLNSESDMYEKEKELISENDNLYNLAEGGLGGDTFTSRSDEYKAITREKLSKSSKISNEKNKSLHSENTTKLWLDEEYREKVLKGVRENAKNPEYRDKLSKGVKKALENPDVKQKWSDCKKGSKNGRWKGTLTILKDDGILETYESIMEASRQTGINRDTISRKTKDGKQYKNKHSKYNGCTFQLDAGGGCDA